MSLPEQWTERIFLKLSVTYGQSFLRQYDGVDLADVKANWGHELAGFQQHPNAIAYGLSYLPPDRPPTVLQFRDMCRRGITVNTTPALPAPIEPPTPEMIEQAKKVYSTLKASAGNHNWAQSLKAKEEGGARLTMFQRQAWREALGVQQ